MMGFLAGRGDTVIAMGLAFLIGIWVGMQVAKLIFWLRKQ